MTHFKIRSRAIIAAIALLLASGCSVTSLQHEGLTPPPTLRDGKLSLSQKAGGLDGSKVGWGRFTPFAIPIVPIYVGGDESEQFMQLVKEALEMTGYTVTLDAIQISEATESLETAGYEVTKEAITGTPRQPLLTADVAKMRYSNYTWLAPIVPTWGGVDATLTLVDPDGIALWTESFDGGGFTFNFFNGYNIASQEALSELLDQMIVAFSGEAFHNAVAGGGDMH